MVGATKYSWYTYYMTKKSVFLKKKPDFGPNTYFVFHEIVIIQKDVVIHYTI